MDKKELKKALFGAADDYLDALISIWGSENSEDLDGPDGMTLDKNHGWWVNDDRTGIYCYDALFSISLSDMVYCVDNGVTLHEYIAWQDYCSEAAEWNFNIPNLNSWHTGCPRVPEETFVALRGRKQQLEDLVEIVKHNPNIQI